MPPTAGWRMSCGQGVEHRREGGTTTMSCKRRWESRTQGEAKAADCLVYKVQNPQDQPCVRNQDRDCLQAPLLGLARSTSVFSLLEIHRAVCLQFVYFSVVMLYFN